ncbi:hypothetical protein [Bradyrhizobium sp. 169]|uniref:hypothetical protein n=1 Tax=Bradyrhizobium sp. 169 TaxID=2782640 RepID=UPI0031F6F0F5
MRFVEPRSEEQQARSVLFRARKRLVHQRTDLVNALRAVLYEFGHIFPQGIEQLKRPEQPSRIRTAICPSWSARNVGVSLTRLPTRRSGRRGSDAFRGKDKRTLASYSSLGRCRG